jgi:hypothetical protein
MFIKVVDMTGREAKILTGYGSFAAQHANPEEESTGSVFSIYYYVLLNIAKYCDRISV